ncbi:MAG: alginate export family protein [Verrucomicrobiota bacterium]
MELHPTLKLQISEDLTWELQHTFFWRQSTDDGLYTAPNIFARAPGDLDAGYVGSEFSTLVAWTPFLDWSVEVSYAHFLPGEFLERSGPAAAIDYFLFGAKKSF